MFNDLKIAFFSVIFAIVAFIIAGNYIIYLHMENDITSQLNDLKFYSNTCIQKIQKKTPLSYELSYEYAILDAKGKISQSNLSVIPPNLAFTTLEFKDYLYYKKHFLNGEKLYYLIVAKKITIYKFYFLITAMVLCVLIMAFVLVYYNYKIISNFYQKQRKITEIFFNDAMHELKTPLGIALINSEMLGDENKHINRIQSALKQMMMTYEDVEYYIKSGKRNLEIKELCISEILKERITSIYQIANTKKIVINFWIEPKLYVSMNEIELIRLIDNTLSNAIKYSNPNSVINVRLKQDKNLAVFSVKDYGVGIKDTNFIWKRYARENKNQGGFGIGLDIVDKICHKYDIEKILVSKENEGSEFTYKIKISKILNKRSDKDFQNLYPMFSDL